MSDFDVIPQEAIDLLKQNPSMAAGFDKVYGTGASERVLMPKAEEAAPVPTEGRSVLGDIGVGITEIPKQAAGGALDALYNIYTAMRPPSLPALEVDLATGEANFEGIPTELPAEKRVELFDKQVEAADELRSKRYEETLRIESADSVTGGLIRGVSQFATGYALAGSLTKLQGIVGGFVNGALVDAFAFDPDDANLTRTLEDLGVDTGLFGEVMATDPDDPDFINRLRNVTEGGIAGSIVEAAGWAFKATKAYRAGRVSDAEKLLLNVDEALNPVRQEIEAGGKVLAEDAQETLRVADEFFGPIKPDDLPKAEPRMDPDGQLLMDLGDTPLRNATPVDPDMAPRKLYLTPEQVEARRYQANLAATAGVDERLTDISARSLDRYSKAEDLITDLAADTVVFKDEFAQMKGGDVQRWATVSRKAARMLREMAEDLGENPDQLVARFQSGGTLNPADLAAEIHARYRFKVTLDAEMRRMADAIAGKGFNPADFNVKSMEELKVKFFEYTQFSVNLNAGLESMTANVGRALNAMKMVKQGDDGIKKILQNGNIFTEVDAMARAIAENPNVSPVKAARDAFEAIHGFLDKINTIRINFLLSGPGTQEVNLISSAINSFAIPSQQIIGGAASMDARAVRHGVKTIQGMLAGYWDALEYAFRSGYYDEAILDPLTGKLDGDAFGRADLFGTTSVGQFMSKTVQLPSRFLMATDEFFKQSAYRGRIFADANELAIQKGLKGDAKTKFIQQYIKESFNEAGGATRSDALLQAQRATFTEPLDPGLASLLQQAAVKSPTVRFFLPFVKTPVNILSTTWQHMPIAGRTSARLRADLAAGGVRRAQARGKQIIGFSLFLMAGYLAATGTMTGSGPKDPRIREAWLKNNQPYAIRVLDENGKVNWISYARLEPMSNILAISADAMEIMNDSYNEIQGAGGKNLLGSIYMAFMENTVNKTFTQGIYDLMKLAMEADQPGGQSALNSMVASFVPNAINQLNGDGVYREARTLADTIMARTHLYNSVDPKRNILGEPVVRTLPKWDPLGLTYKDVREIDPVMEVLTEVMMANRSAIAQPARTLEGPSKIDLSTVPYKNGQSLYDRYLELIGTTEIGGKNLRERIAEEIEKPYFKRAPMGDTNVSPKGTKAEILRKIILAYRQKAQSELPELRELIIAEKRNDGQIKLEQLRQNRALFPLAPVTPSTRPRRTFEDLLKE